MGLAWIARSCEMYNLLHGVIGNPARRRDELLSQLCSTRLPASWPMLNFGGSPKNRNDAATSSGGALHENLVRNEEPVDPPSDRRFGLTIGIACFFVGGIRLMLGHGDSEWCLVAGLFLRFLA
jgi:hypothetical protein